MSVPGKRFCQEISQVVFSADPLSNDSPIERHFPQEMILQLNVLCAVV
jgi:hypothetical protein